MEGTPFRPMAVAVGAALLLLAGAGRSSALAQAPCRPPSDLRVCQDQYGSRGRVFLVWTNGESTYARVRIFMDGTAAGEGPGSARIGYIDEIPAGPHTFSVEGVCDGVATERITSSFTVVSITPHLRPIESMNCVFDPALGRLTATWVLSSRPSIFIDVYIRRAGLPGLLYVTTIAGDANAVVIDGTVDTDRLQLQFFDALCYGSELAGCPGPSCLPPVKLRVCQDLYGQQSRVFLLWLPGAASYTAFEILMDGVEVGQAPGTSGLFYVDPVAPGPHTFGVRGVCGGETTEPVTRPFEVLPASPHAEPARNLHCERDLARHTIAATWLPGAAPSDFIDVYVRTPGASLLDFAGTIAGDSTRVRVTNTGPDDEVVLQFFNASCYGSPLLSCGNEPGSRGFIRGDSNGSATIDLSDAVAELRFLFLGDADPLCFDAADANDDARVNIADPIFILNWLFGGGPPPPLPGPSTCGPDPTADTLPPCLTAACP